MRKPILTAVACVAGAMFSLAMVYAGEKTGDVLKKLEAENSKSDKSKDEMPAKEMDKHFVEMAAQANLFEIQWGQYATEHVKGFDERAFAEKIVTDHQKAQDELMAWGKSSSTEVPTSLDDLHQKKLAHVESMHGKHFEKAFVYHNVADHMLCVLMFRDASEELKNQELKDYATKQLPVLREHLAMAEKLANFDGADARAASDKIRASAEKVPVTR